MKLLTELLKFALKRNPSHRNVGKEKEPREMRPRIHFEICILGPQPSQAAQFKTRGKHPVRKVLQAAYKAFGLD